MAAAGASTLQRGGWRRWFQFRLGTLLLAVLLASLVLGWWQARERQLAGHAPTHWEVGSIARRGFPAVKARNIKWRAPLGSLCFSGPVVSGGKVFVGTNNEFAKPYAPQNAKAGDMGVLLCFRESDGKFLWQASTPKHAAGRAIDHPLLGIYGKPLVEGNRLWYVTNRCEVVCLDTEGFYDRQNDGDVTDELPGDAEADVVWRLDLYNQLGVRPHEISPCTPAADDQRLFIVTGNAIHLDHRTIPAPGAPSFLALDKRTGKVLWSDNSASKNILHTHWGSPTYAVIGGVPQVIFPGGDGWIYSFAPAGTPDGKSKLLWKFDVNLKASVHAMGGRGDRNEDCYSVTVYKDRVYVTPGQDPEHGTGPGQIWCIDATGRGDLSAELVVTSDEPPLPVAPRRGTAVNTEAGEVVVPNPNSGVVWKYTGFDINGDGELQSEETMHRTRGGLAIRDGVLYAVDFEGIVHCVDADTGALHWMNDLYAPVWCPPLISGDHLYICDEDGDVTIFRLPDDPRKAVPKQFVAELFMNNSMYASPTVSNRVLFIANKDTLFAIAEEKP